MRFRYILAPLPILTLLALAGWLAFQPRFANHFGYALPISNGLPCRLHYRGRDYENDEQCVGMNRSAWSVWYAAHHRVPSGGPCEKSASLKRTGDELLHEVASISTLLGSPDPIFISRGY